MELETRSIVGDVWLPCRAGDCTLPQRQARELPLPSGAVVAIGAMRAVEQADELVGQVSWADSPEGFAGHWWCPRANGSRGVRRSQPHHREGGRPHGLVHPESDTNRVLLRRVHHAVPHVSLRQPHG